MLSTGVMAVFGFFFWIINACLYSAEQDGVLGLKVSSLRGSLQGGSDNSIFP